MKANLAADSETANPWQSQSLDGTSLQLQMHDNPARGSGSHQGDRGSPTATLPSGRVHPACELDLITEKPYHRDVIIQVDATFRARVAVLESNQLDL